MNKLHHTVRNSRGVVLAQFLTGCDARLWAETYPMSATVEDWTGAVTEHTKAGVRLIDPGFVPETTIEMMQELFGDRFVHSQEEARNG